MVGQLYRAVLGGRGYVGAEYWMRAQRADAVFFLHFDRDEAVRGRYVCPARSSVLYLSEVGGPTVILPATPETEARPRSAAIVWPSPGRYALFPGELLHGVLPGPASRWPRVAFFVNWWRAPLVSPRESTPELRRASPPAGLGAAARPGPRRSRAMPQRIEERAVPAGGGVAAAAGQPARDGRIAAARAAGYARGGRSTRSTRSHCGSMSVTAASRASPMPAVPVRNDASSTGPMRGRPPRAPSLEAPRASPPSAPLSPPSSPESCPCAT